MINDYTPAELSLLFNIISDDISDNNAFIDFYSTKKIIPILLKNEENEISLGILRK